MLKIYHGELADGCPVSSTSTKQPVLGNRIRVGCPAHQDRPPPRRPRAVLHHMMLNLRDNWSLATKTHWATNASLNAESFSL